LWVCVPSVTSAVMKEQRIFAGSAGRKQQAFATKATVKDVFYCFRLLLGRHPSQEEWLGHAARAGEDLTGLVASFARSLECSRRELLDHDHLAEIVLSQQPDFQLYSAADDVAVGAHVRGGSYEPDVAAIFRRFLRPGMQVIDIGANIGYFTMLSAVLVGSGGSVLAIEPNPRNIRLLEASRQKNGFDHVTVMQLAAGRTPGLLVLNTSYSNGTTAAPPDRLNALLASETVACMDIDAVLPGDASIGFIKVDVEGAEYNALQGCLRTIRRDRPVIVSEFSPGLMPGISGIDGAGYLRFLIDLGYDLSIIRNEGRLVQGGEDPAHILSEHLATGLDHIDIVAIPRVHGRG
jgi:FkbM family methyltransferase